MFKSLLRTGTTALMSAVVLLVLSAITSVGAPSAQAPNIVRTNLLVTPVDLPAGTYNLTLAELSFDPGAETPLHQHPGPSMGFAEVGRITVTIPSEGGATSSHAAGSAFNHPWDRPHIFKNATGEPFKMLAFELNPVAVAPPPPPPTSEE